MRARAATTSGTEWSEARCFALRSSSRANTDFARNFFCWAMWNTAWNCASAASSSSVAQNARAAFSRCSLVIPFHSRAGVNVVSVISCYSMRMRHTSARAALVSACAFAIAVAVAAQQAGVHPLSGRRFAQTMGVEGADWLDRSERDLEENPDRAIDVLKIEKGATVADVGAGSGYMTVKLSKKVGAQGKVYANDIQQGMLDLLNKRLARSKITNVTTVLGTQDDPRLPPEALDLVIMVDVYHELSQPQVMLGRIRGSLKPGGRLVLLEYRKEDPDVPIRPEHKMSVADAKLEVEAEGFKLTKTNEDLPRQHILIFTRP